MTSNKTMNIIFNLFKLILKFDAGYFYYIINNNNCLVVFAGRGEISRF